MSRWLHYTCALLRCGMQRIHQVICEERETHSPIGIAVMLETGDTGDRMEFYDTGGYRAE